MRNRLFIILSIFSLISFSCSNQNSNKDSYTDLKSDRESKVAYLAAYMKGDDDKNMYYALSKEGFIFKELNNGQSVLSASFDDKLVRDPMIIKDKNGVYHMVATVSWSNRSFTVWDSEDLITWKNERLVDVAPEGATKTWAPEFTYDEENDVYFAHWTAELNNDWNTASIYYSTTTDFINFSEPKILFSLDSIGILDANIIKVDNVYNLLYRNNGVWVATSENAQGPYSEPYLLSQENVEGPFAFTLNDGSGYGVVWDYFGRSLGFGLWTSPDFKNWETITNKSYPYYNEKVEFPAGIRHGSIIGLFQKEVDLLIEKYGVN